MTNEKPARRTRKPTFQEMARLADAAHLADLEREHPGGRYPDIREGAVAKYVHRELPPVKRSPEPAKTGVVVRIVGYQGCMRRRALEISMPRLRCLEAA